MQKTRHTFQFLFFFMAVWLTLRNLLGLTKATVESYCPVGGLESILFFLKNHAFLCATSGINLILFLAILIGTIVAGRAFCSWVCPIGTIMEILRKLGVDANLLNRTFWKKSTKIIGYLRYPLLAVILYYTLQITDLIFRTYCPYYIVISGQEHELAWWAKWLMLVLGGIAIVIPFFWCKVICPFGAFLGIVRLVSPIAPAIKTSNCVSCGKCDEACPQQIPIMASKRVWSTDCTQCLICTESCPKNCVELHAGYQPISNDSIAATKITYRRFTKGVIPLIVALMMGLGFFFAFNFPLPTMTKYFPTYNSGAKLSRADIIVNGLRCRGTANTLGWILEQDRGIAGIEAYVSEAKARIFYDSAKTDPQKISVLINSGRISIDAKTGEKKLINFFKVKEIQNSEK